MMQFAYAALGVLLLYLALRVVQLKRPGRSFLIAYPLFVFILVGGAMLIFVLASNSAAVLALPREWALGASFATTAVALIPLWRIARWAIS